MIISNVRLSGVGEKRTRRADDTGLRASYSQLPIFPRTEVHKARKKIHQSPVFALEAAAQSCKDWRGECGTDDPVIAVLTGVGGGHIFQNLRRKTALLPQLDTLEISERPGRTGGGVAGRHAVLYSKVPSYSGRRSSTARTDSHFFQMVALQ